MTENLPYGNPAAVEAAIAEAARKAARADPSLGVQERIRLEYFDRFLSRVFSDSSDSGWVLKGGTAMLARVASARSTTDVDLFRQRSSLDEALSDLRRLAAIDLGDFFRFDYTRHVEVIDPTQQTYAEGYQVSFDVSIGAKRKVTLNVDLVVSAVATDIAEVTTPAHALDLPRLVRRPYRLYAVVDQIADKVCATLAVYSGRASSREKDLVDLVVLACTQDVGAAELLRAITSEAGARSLALPQAFDIPAAWGARYARLASKVPACASYRSVDAARDLMSRFINQALDGRASGKTWDHEELCWT